MYKHISHDRRRATYDKVLQAVAGNSYWLREAGLYSATAGMGDSMASQPEDQGRLLEDALGQVRQQTHLMRKCLETPGKLMDALKHRYVRF
jgi:hypothetical protein